MKDTINGSFTDINTQKVLFGKLIESIEKRLLDIPRYQIYSREWKTLAPNHAGVYFVWEDASIIYVGESANIKNILRLVGRTKALVCPTIFFIVEVKWRSRVLWDLESV